MPEEQEGFVVTGDEKEEFVMLEFSDGVFTLNKAMVAHLGGAEEVRKYTDQAKLITRDEFVKGFWQLVSAAAINNTANVIVQQHLANPFNTREINLENDFIAINPFPPAY